MLWRSIVLMLILSGIFRWWQGGAQTSVEQLEAAPVRQLEAWSGWRQKTLSQRLAPASRILARYLVRDNIRQGWSERPQSMAIDAEMRRDLQAALDELPELIQERVSEKLVGIFAVKELGGSAYTESIFDADGNEVAAFVVLDLTALNRTANEWMSWKENSPFRRSRGQRIVAEIAGTEGDHRRAALQYILLHEFGHVLAVGEDVTPTWSQRARARHRQRLSERSFYRISWQPDGLKSLYDETYKTRKLLRFYAAEPERLDFSAAVAAYRFLETSSFPTLYAATSAYDDWAESFANYVHTVLMAKPYRLQIRDQGRVLLSYQHCWAQERCLKKRRALEKFLGLGAHQ